MIGGIECKLVAPPIDDVFDLILSVCRRWWPDGDFLDANEDTLIPLTGPALAWQPQSDEFFIFHNRRVAETWDELGPCAENWNQMLHFLLRRQQTTNGQHTRVTLIVDERTHDVEQLLHDLQTTFRDADAFALLEQAA